MPTIEKVLNVHYLASLNKKIHLNNLYAFFACVTIPICSMIVSKEGKDMQRISLSWLVFTVFAGTANAAYLPVVDVSRGGISARAAFGEELKPIVRDNPVNVASNPAPVQKKVVARAAAKPSVNNITVGGDVLKPNRPRSDLWAKNGDTPLRMPRMDEIAVLNSDFSLPEESLDLETMQKIAKVSEPKVKESKKSEPKIAHNEAMDELKKLRAEISRLAAAQRDTEEKIAQVRPIVVQTPITGESDVKPVEKVEKIDGVNIHRTVVMDDSVQAKSTPNVIARSIYKKSVEPEIASVGNQMSKMSPNELKKAFKKTYLSENKHLSTYQVDDKFDTISDMSSSTGGFDTSYDLSEMDGGVRPMEIKISFLNNDSGLSRENYNLLTETAAIVVNNPKRAIQIAIPESVTKNKDARKLASRRLAIIEQVLRDTGIAERRIVPVLSQRNDDVFVLRIISNDVFESLTEQKRNMFGDSVSKKTYKSMSW